MTATFNRDGNNIKPTSEYGLPATEAWLKGEIPTTTVTDNAPDKIRLDHLRLYEDKSKQFRWIEGDEYHIDDGTFELLATLKNDGFSVEISGASDHHHDCINIKVYFPKKR